VLYSINTLCLDSSFIEYEVCGITVSVSQNILVDHSLPWMKFPKITRDHLQEIKTSLHSAPLSLSTHNGSDIALG